MVNTRQNYIGGYPAKHRWLPHRYTHLQILGGEQNEQGIFLSLPGKLLGIPLANSPEKFIQVGSEGRGGGTAPLGLLW